jgi:hypothetical protein
VNSLKLLTSCPKFEKVKLLPYRVRSAVSEEAFKVFVSVIGGTDPALTNENINDMLVLCEEFGFVALRSKVSVFEMRASVVDKEVRRRMSGVLDGNLDQALSLFPGAGSCGSACSEFAPYSQKLVSGTGNWGDTGGAYAGICGDPRRTNELGRGRRARAGEL